MSPDPLLAKSWPGEKADVPPELTLVGHTARVLAAVDALFGADGPTRLGRSWLRFFRVDEGEFPRFRRLLRVAAAAHDWGKGHDGYQAMVTRGGVQAVRHEHLSALLLADPAVSGWLVESGVEARVVLAAVLGHHLKAGGGNVHRVGETRLDSLLVLSDHPDFRAIWRMIQDEVGVDAPATITFPGWARGREIEAAWEALRSGLDSERRRLRGDPAAARWVAAVRAGLIAADAVGSAAVRMDDDRGGDGDRRIDPGSLARHADRLDVVRAREAVRRLSRWVARCFDAPLTADEVWRDVVMRRVDELRKDGRWDDSTGRIFRGRGGFKPFQCDVASLGPRVLLIASCGSGKTLAAYLWIIVQLERRAREGRPASRVLFLYPTRATATEGFRDYVSWAPGDHAGLLSGTAAYELRGLFAAPEERRGPGTPPDPRAGRDYGTDPRLFALGSWTKRVFSATADQFLPFLQNAHGPLCLLPLLAEAVVVVDEVHGFDRSMFSTLKRFLREFPDVPALCMTATLPASRRKDLVELDGGGLVAFPGPRPGPAEGGTSGPLTIRRGSRGRPPSGPSEDEARTERYVVEWIDREDARDLVRRELDDRRRVLWVCNRVVDCQENFRLFRGLVARSPDPRSPLGFCYHGRFRLVDRQARHKELLAEFQASAHEDSRVRGLVGVTTQICETSFELDAEVLLTALAPISPVIQRTGRCNRDSSKLARRPLGRVYVIRPEAGEEKPYEKPDLDAARGFVDEIVGRPISQAELEHFRGVYDPGGVEPELLCPFLDGGAYALGKEASFRDVDEYAVPCVLDDLEGHVEKILRDGGPSGRVVDGFLVPVPRRFATGARPEGSWFPRWLSVASARAYDRIVGFDEVEAARILGRGIR